MDDVVEVMARGIHSMARKYGNNDPFEKYQSEWLEEARAALSALSEAGWVVVKKEITEAQGDAFFSAREEYENLKAARVFPRPTLAAYIWKAMLSAAPAPK